MSATSLVHDPFVAMLEYFKESGQTVNERELAALALNLYLCAPDHPLMVNMVNRYALEMMK